MDRTLAFKAAHAAAKRAMAEQIEIKHPSAHKTYKQLFALCLKGYYINQSKPYERVNKLEWVTIGGTHD